MITSAHNPLLKAVRRSLARGTPIADGRIAVETWHLFEEAVNGPAQITAVLCEPRLLLDVENALPGGLVEIREVDASVLAGVASTETSPGVITLLRPVEWTWDALRGGQPRIVVADGIQDPGNLGTIQRTAEAFAASGMAVLKGTVHPWNPKVLRASAGSGLRLPMRAGVDPAECAAWLAAQSIAPHVADAQLGVAANEVDWGVPWALVLGSETAGPASSVWSGATRVRIPMHGVESLNVAVAAAILLYESARPRA